MIRVITGSMFSGKSTELLRQLRCAQIAGQKTILLKPTTCTRKKDHIVTHDQVTMQAHEFNPRTPQPELQKFLCALKPEVIGIDEAQFLHSTWWIDWLRTWSIDREVICACLNQDYKGKPFGFSPTLLALADDIVHLKAVCVSCNGKNTATRTNRISESTDQVQIGGVESYQASCPACWEKKRGPLPLAAAN